MIYSKLKEIIPNNATIIEIGAHIGTDTTRLARLLLPPFTYLAIEPDLRNVERLRPICERHGIELIEGAIGAKSEIVDFWFSSIPDCNSLKKPLPVSTRPANTTFEQKPVMCFRLDDIIKAYGLSHIDLIWMDVQGAELEVFSGAVETLRLTDYLYTECQSGRYEGQPGLKGILAALPGWKVMLKNGDNVLLRKGSKDG